jgi:hypothetical protein
MSQPQVNFNQQQQQQQQILGQQTDFSKTSNKLLQTTAKPITPSVVHQQQQYQPITTTNFNQPYTPSAAAATANMTNVQQHQNQQQQQSSFVQIFVPKLAPVNNNTTPASNVNMNGQQHSNVVFTPASNQTISKTALAKKATTPRAVTPKTAANLAVVNAKTPPATSAPVKRQAKKRTNSSTNVPIAPLNTATTNHPIYGGNGHVTICNGNAIQVTGNTMGHQNLNNIAPKTIQAKPAITPHDSNPGEILKFICLYNIPESK